MISQSQSTGGHATAACRNAIWSWSKRQPLPHWITIYSCRQGKPLSSAAWSNILPWPIQVRMPLPSAVVSIYPNPHGVRIAAAHLLLHKLGNHSPLGRMPYLVPTTTSALHQHLINHRMELLFAMAHHASQNSSIDPRLSLIHDLMIRDCRRRWKLDERHATQVCQQTTQPLIQTTVQSAHHGLVDTGALQTGRRHAARQRCLRCSHCRKFGYPDAFSFSNSSGKSWDKHHPTINSGMAPDQDLLITRHCTKQADVHLR